MPAPDLVLELPDGWTELPNEGGPVTYSPDGGDSVLQLSSPGWASRLRGQTVDALEPVLAKIVDGGGLGRATAVGERAIAYGRSVRAEVESGESGDVIAWLLVPAIGDVVLATWIAGSETHRETAAAVLATAQPGLFSNAIASAVEIGSKALAANELMPHAVLYGNGELTYLQLQTVPHEIWDEVCRVERDRVKANVVVQVLPATANDREVFVIYAESPTRQRRVLVDAGVAHDLDTERVDLFAAPDPRIVAALAEARSES